MPQTASYTQISQPGKARVHEKIIDGSTVTAGGSASDGNGAKSRDENDARHA